MVIGYGYRADSTIYGGSIFINSNVSNGDFVDSLQILNVTSGQRVQIGMTTNDSDGQHHRVSLRAYKGAGSLEGTFGIALRQTSAAHVQRLTLTSLGNLSVDGSMTAAGFFESSDARLKTIVNEDYRIDAIVSIKPKFYQKNGKFEAGYIAQEVDKVFSHAVSIGDDGYLNLSYTQVHTLKIAALEDSVDDIKKKISELEQKLNSLY